MFTSYHPNGKCPDPPKATDHAGYNGPPEKVNISKVQKLIFTITTSKN